MKKIFLIILAILVPAALIAPITSARTTETTWIKKVEWQSDYPLTDPIKLYQENSGIAGRGYFPNSIAPTSGFYYVISASRCWSLTMISGKFYKMWQETIDCPNQNTYKTYIPIVVH